MHYPPVLKDIKNDNVFVKLFKESPDIDAGLAASIFHFGEVKIGDLKDLLRRNDIIVR